VVVFNPGPPSVEASVVVAREPAGAQVLLPLYQVPETRSSPVHVTMTQHIWYVSCYGKVELTALMLGPTACPHRPVVLAVKGRGGFTSSRLVAPCCHLPSMKHSRWCLDHRQSCSPRHLHGGTSSPASPGPCFEVSGGLLRSTWGTLQERCQLAN
jgi:hypothetical protein